MDKKYLVLTQKGRTYYVYSYKEKKIYYFYGIENSVNKPKGRVQTYAVFSSVIGAQIFPHIWKAFNFDVLETLKLKFLFLIIILFSSWIGGFWWVHKQVFKYELDRKKNLLIAKENLKEIMDYKEILKELYKNSQKIKKVVTGFLVVDLMMMSIFIHNGDLIWLTILGLISFVTSLILNFLGINTKDNEFVTSPKETYYLLKKLKKEGVF